MHNIIKTIKFKRMNFNRKRQNIIYVREHEQTKNKKITIKKLNQN